MVLIAFAVRVLWIVVAHTYRIRTTSTISASALRPDASRIRWQRHGLQLAFGGNTALGVDGPFILDCLAGLPGVR